MVTSKFTIRTIRTDYCYVDVLPYGKHLFYNYLVNHFPLSNVLDFAPNFKVTELNLHRKTTYWVIFNLHTFLVL